VSRNPATHVAERHVQVAVQVGRAGGVGVEPVRDPQRQPRPGARLVAGEEDRVGAARGPRGDVADRPLEPGNGVGRAVLVGAPADHAEVVLAQPVAEGGLGRVDVHPLARQQLADPGGAHGAAVAQPVLPLPRVGRDDLLRGLVDVPGHDGGDLHRDRGDHPRVLRLPGQLLEAPLKEDRVAQPVRPQQRGQRGAALRPAARLLHRRGRGVHVGQVDLVLHDLQAGRDVAVDA
jgi:hypothetical protein